MKIRLFLVMTAWLLMAAQVATYGHWTVYERTSETTGTQSKSSKAGEYVRTGDVLVLEKYFGLRCDVQGQSKTLLFIFDAGESVAEPRSDVTIAARVDDNPSVRLAARTFAGSSDTGYARFVALAHADLLEQMKAGTRASILVTGPTGRSDYVVSLIGFTAANAPIIEMCGR